MIEWNPKTDDWKTPITHRKEKEAVAKRIAEKARENEVIGAGSGSTVHLALEALAEKVQKENLHIHVIPASLETSMTCIRLGIPQLNLWERKPDWSFDGADEIDPEHNLIKGRGGALFKEKLLICHSAETYIIADTSKFVDRLGSHFPVPVEIFPQALPYVENRLKTMDVQEIVLRAAQGKDGPVITENGNLILDVRFRHITADTEQKLKLIPGVIESGLFIGYPVKIVSVV